MRPQRPGKAHVCALALALLWLGALAAHAQQSEAPPLSLDDISDTLVQDEPPPAPEAWDPPLHPEAPAAPPAPAPGLKEATQSAVHQVLDAARRDGASWAQRTSETRDALLAELVAGWQRLRANPQRTIDAWLVAAGLPDSEALLIPALGVLAVLVALLVLVRGRGDLKVSLEYPAELRGTFHVRITRKKNTTRKGPSFGSPSAAQRAKRRASASSKTQRHLVSRETDFPEVPMGRWFVCVDGFMQPQDDEAVIATYFEEQEVQVRRGHTVRVDFDFHPKQCPVDVKITWDKKPVAEALVAWRGHPHSLRYARGGPVRLGVHQGKQTLVVGCGDRVAEIELEVASFQPLSLELDLADRERLLFTGCPPAVEPYLYSDVPAAARALEREGQQEASHLMLARLHEERGQHDKAARHYAEAGRLQQAAEIHRDLAQFEESAALFESAGDFAGAAEMYQSAGDVIRAGDAYERARDYDQAAQCFREAGDVAKWVDALEKAGAPFEAAQVAIEKDDWGRAIRSLHRVEPSDDEYPEASRLLIEGYEHQGHLDLAAERVEELIRHRGPEAMPLEVCDRLAGKLRESRRFDRAIDMLEIIRRRDATYPGIATRIEDLRKQQRQRSSGSAPAPPVPGAEGFGDEFRYEIMEEVGRGGMGVVFKARDRRLGRVVALKRLPDNLANHPKAVELFLREARAAASLNHPNIVTVHDVGQEGDAFYITMELLEGYTLQQVLKRNKRLGVRDAARLGIQVCHGLQYAHEKRIVHRDIKTGNFFFTTGKTLKIMDFGLAKMVEEVRRASTIIGGTPYYMAPEQSLGGAVDHRADLYALGVTFFELLTGRVPFAEGDVAFHHRHSTPPDPRERVPDIPDAFVELIHGMMEKEPDARPASAGEVSELLQDIVDSLD